MSRREADAAVRRASIGSIASIWLAIAAAVLAVAILFRLREGDRPAHAETVAGDRRHAAPRARPCPASAGRSTT